MVSVSFRCDDCGAILEWPDDAIDSTIITCKKCGLLAGTYGDIRREAERAVQARFDRLFNDGADSG